MSNRRFQVDGQLFARGLPMLGLGEGDPTLDARIVDENIDRAEFF